ncbi:MAG: hypothetical protein KME29_04835 [Calothrix sp. FI2-JRJ7]|jgi:hypothetical protein|nr:hypothetical protein [Calothrix sp. FI2-JRJ7]
MSDRQIEIDNRPKAYTPMLAAALKDLGVPNPTAAAIFVNQLAFWLNTKSGHLTKDGEKFIYNTYEHWRQQFPCMSESQIGRMIRSLCGLGIVVKETFSSLKRRLINKPVGFQEYNQTSWMTLCISKLAELADWIGYDPESLLGANLQKCRLEDSLMQNPTCASEFSTIYTKKTLSLADEEGQEKEVFKTQEEEAPQNSKVNGLIQESFVKTEVPNSDQLSRACSDMPKKRTIANTQNDSRELHVWEIALDEPYPLFLTWWAERHYKPQGGHRETGARIYARNQFYRDPKGANEIFKEFLAYLNTTTDSCNQLQNDGQKAILPSYFVPLPEATEENVQALMNNITTLVERGADVLMPTKSATPTSQALPFEEAQCAATIKALPALEEVDIEAELRRQRSFYNQPEKEVELLNEWLNGASNVLKQEAQKLAMVRRYGLERDSSGDIVKVFINQNALPKATNSTPSNALNNIDWGSISAQCQELEKDAWEGE